MVSVLEMMTKLWSFLKQAWIFFVRFWNFKTQHITSRILLGPHSFARTVGPKHRLPDYLTWFFVWLQQLVSCRCPTKMFSYFLAKSHFYLSVMTVSKTSHNTWIMKIFNMRTMKSNGYFLGNKVTLDILKLTLQPWLQWKPWTLISPSGFFLYLCQGFYPLCSSLTSESPPSTAWSPLGSARQKQVEIPFRFSSLCSREMLWTQNLKNNWPTTNIKSIVAIHRICYLVLILSPVWFDCL